MLLRPSLLPLILMLLRLFLKLKPLIVMLLLLLNLMLLPPSLMLLPLFLKLKPLILVLTTLPLILMLRPLILMLLPLILMQLPLVLMPLPPILMLPPLMLMLQPHLLPLPPPPVPAHRALPMLSPLLLLAVLSLAHAMRVLTLHARRHALINEQKAGMQRPDCMGDPFAFQNMSLTCPDHSTHQRNHCTRLTGQSKRARLLMTREPRCAVAPRIADEGQLLALLSASGWCSASAAACIVVCMGAP